MKSYNFLRTSGRVFKREELTTTAAVIIPLANAPIPTHIWVYLEAADIAAGVTVTVSLSKDNELHYDVLAVVTTASWEDDLLSDYTHVKFQASVGGTGSCGVTG